MLRLDTHGRLPCNYVVHKISISPFTEIAVMPPGIGHSSAPPCTRYVALGFKPRAC